MGKPTGESSDTKQRILEIAIELIESSSNNSLRIEDVVTQSGLSFPTIYFHFGDRAGLLREAQIEIFKRSFSSETDTFAQFAKSVDDIAVLLPAVFMQILKNCEDKELITQRHQRLRVMSNAITDPQLMQEVLNLQSIPIRKFELIFQDLAERNVINPDLDCEAFARWLLGLLAGRVLIEVDESRSRQAVDHLLAIAIIVPLLKVPLNLQQCHEFIHLVRAKVRKDSAFSQTDVLAQTPEQHDELATTLLQLVSEQINRSGEASVRLAEIAAQANVSLGSLTRRFASRDHLIDSALARDFTKHSMSTSQKLNERLTGINSLDEMVASINELFAETASNPDYVALRIQRVQILGLALSRPELASLVSKSLGDFEMTIQPGMQALVSNGALSGEANPASFLALAQIIQLGRVVVDFNHIEDTNQSWLKMTQNVSEFFLREIF
mgnify:CR=1 FL=1